MQNVYERRLRWALDHRLIIMAGSAVVLLGSVGIYAAAGHGVEYFPEDIPPKQVFIDIELPVGARVEATDSLLHRLESEIMRVEGRTDWKSTVAIAGGGGGTNGAAAMTGAGGPGGPGEGRIAISYVDFQDREYDTFDRLAWMQQNIGRDIAGAEVTVEKLQDGPQSGAPVNIEIVGEDPDLLKDLSEQALQVLRADAVFEKLVGLESDLNSARPELSVRVDREKAGLYDLSTADIGNTVRGAIQGIEAAKYRTGNEEYDIVVRLAPRYRQELDQLAELSVMADGGRQVPLSSVASWSVGEGFGTIRRKDQERVATLSSDVAEGLNSNAVLVEVRTALSDFQNNLPPGYNLDYTGQQEEQEEAGAFLTRAFMIAIFLIGFILVSQFNSVVKPVIILTSVMMSTAGVLLGLVIFQMPFGVVMTGVGVISLAGIVVNNAIVLIDYIDILRDRDGMNRREALVAGGKTRFRPVVLTALTTALGLVPLAIGLNFDFFGLYDRLNPDLFWGGEQAAWWGPMAIAVIAGIIFATFLTLVLVPVMYSLVDDFTHFFEKHFVKEDAVQDEVDVEGDRHAPSSGPGGGTATDRPDKAPPRPREPEPASAFRTGSPLGGPELRPE